MKKIKQKIQKKAMAENHQNPKTKKCTKYPYSLHGISVEIC